MLRDDILHLCTLPVCTPLTSHQPAPHPQTMGRHGAAALVEAAQARGRARDGRLRVLTHCNTGSLATAAYGTALGVIRALHEQGRLEHAYCCETRPYNQASGKLAPAQLAGEVSCQTAMCCCWGVPAHHGALVSPSLLRADASWRVPSTSLLQGARLTAYELVHDGLPSTLICDSAAAALMAQGKVDAVVVGADRIAANGDTGGQLLSWRGGCGALDGLHGVRFARLHCSQRRFTGGCSTSRGIRLARRHWFCRLPSCPNWGSLGALQYHCASIVTACPAPCPAANKIGTFCHAVTAHHHDLPFFVAAPTTTIDPQLDNGTLIPIEERAAEEVRSSLLVSCSTRCLPVPVELLQWQCTMLLPQGVPNSKTAMWIMPLNGQVAAHMPRPLCGSGCSSQLTMPFHFMYPTCPLLQITHFKGQQVAADFGVWNPSFDVTPATLIEGIITERVGC